MVRERGAEMAITCAGARLMATLMDSQMQQLEHVHKCLKEKIQQDLELGGIWRNV